MHYFPAYTMEAVLWELPYVNMLMLMATTPQFDYGEDTESVEEIVKGSDVSKPEDFAKLADFINNKMG